LIAGNVSIGNGQLRLVSTAGDLTKNTQDNALDVAYNTGRDFVTTTRLTSYPFTKNWSARGSLSARMRITTSTRRRLQRRNAIQFGSEIGGVFTSLHLPT